LRSKTIEATSSSLSTRSGRNVTRPRWR
jgi:hypothetical protein